MVLVRTDNYGDCLVMVRALGDEFPKVETAVRDLGSEESPRYNVVLVDADQYTLGTKTVMNHHLRSWIWGFIEGCELFAGALSDMLMRAKGEYEPVRDTLRLMARTGVQSWRGYVEQLGGVPRKSFKDRGGGKD